ncbi:MAG: pyrroloquinoline quinone-dependent dehydrogenase, partial [Acidobacteria bacterium]
MTTFMSRLSAGIAVAAAIGAAGVARYTATQTDAADGWSASNHDQSANRYSPLTQITPANVSTLQRAWSIHLEPAGYSGKLITDEAIPLVIGNTMYVGSPYGAVIALDATTGAEKWTFQLPNKDIPAKRGIAYWPGGDGRPASIV